MENNVTMKARDTVAAKLAECFITIDGRRYNFMQMIDMEAKVEKTKSTVPRLGAIMAGHKSCGMEGTFSVRRIITSPCFARRFWTTRIPDMISILRCRLPMMIPPATRADKPSFFMTAIPTGACWPSLTLTANIWMRKLRVLLKTSPCLNPSPS